MLIINADDWGFDRHHTDAILACFRAGRITSTSAMVHMEDSERAAALARAERLPVGLHLNFIDAFTATSIPPEIRLRQDTLVRYFSRGGWRRWGFSPRRYQLVQLAIADQWAEFCRLYQNAPTHLDGHQHLHQNLMVLSSRTIPRGAKLRPSFTFQAGEKPRYNRAARFAVNRLMRLRFPGPSHFVSIRSLHPALGGTGLHRLRTSDRHTLEVMTHPGWDDEFSLLLSGEWDAAIRNCRLGSYADL